MRCRYRTRRSWWRSREGTGAIEFAIIAPVFFLFMMGIFEFGRLFWVQVSLQNAVEQTVRYAMAEYTRETFNKATRASFSTWFNAWGSGLQSSASGEIFGWDPTGIIFTVARTGAATSTTVDQVKLSATYQFDFVLLIVPGWTNQTLYASAQVPLIGSQSSYLPTP
jgi:Flp pilus assembly protein TadG